MLRLNLKGENNPSFWKENDWGFKIGLARVADGNSLGTKELEWGGCFVWD